MLSEYTDCATVKSILRHPVFLNQQVILELWQWYQISHQYRLKYGKRMKIT